MNSDAQLFSIDFLFSLIFVIFAFGSLLNIVELFNYYAMQEIDLYKIKKISEIAATDLVYDTNHCYVTNNNGDLKFVIPNCLTTLPNDCNAPSGYGCDIYLDTLPSSYDKNFFYITKRIILYSQNRQNISYGDFNKCLKNVDGCMLEPRTLYIYVYKG
ncbi:MAG: hypothetical protein N3D73_01365 [Candidatus Diapherotrites archaeon]|nr:hypothetical protein [Candidatus Diapherotrites archaeon]